MSISDADFVIRSGRVIDGTGKPEFVADIAVTGLWSTILNTFFLKEPL